MKEKTWRTVINPKPEAVDEAWEDKNEYAVVTIMLSVVDRLVKYIKKCKDAHEMREKLEEVFGRDNVGMWHKLYHIRFATGSMTDHIDKMLSC